MNHTYRVVYNETTNTYVAVSENEPARGKKSKSVKTAVAAAVALTFGGASGMASALMTDSIAGGSGRTNILIKPNGGTAPSVSGENSIAIGASTKGHTSTVSIGHAAEANDRFGVAIGRQVEAAGAESVALGTMGATGPKTIAKGTQALALGTRNQAIGNQSIAAGNDTFAGGFGSIAIGTDDTGTAQTPGNAQTIVSSHRYLVDGDDKQRKGEGFVRTDKNNPDTYISTVAQGSGALSLGAHTQSLHHGATAIGAGAVAGMGKVVSGTFNTNDLNLDSIRGIQATAIGSQSFAASDRTTAVGTNSMAGGANATAVGAGAVAYSKQTIAIGDGAMAGSNGESNTSRLSEKGADKADAIAIGTKADAQGLATVALGAGASAARGTDGAVVIGWNAKSSDGGSRHLDRENPFNPLSKQENLTKSGSVYVIKNAGSMLATNAGIEGNTSSVSVVIGPNADATGGNGGVALGDRAKSGSGLSIAIGANAHAVKKANQGTSTIAIGPSAYASGNTALALGRQSAADADFAQAIGNVAAATGKGSLAVGHSANATGYRAIAIGSSNINDAGGTVGSYGTQAGTNYQKDSQARASGDDAIAFGSGAQADSYTSIAIGAFADAEPNANHTIAFGNEAKASGVKGISVGFKAKNSAETATAIGSEAEASNKNAIAVGTKTQTSGERSLAVGFENKVSGTDSGVFGNKNQNSKNKTFVVGNSVNPTQDNSVILGDSSTDRAATTENTANVNGLKYSGFAGQGAPAKGVVSVGKQGGERQIINVAAGKIDKNSTDAINGSQLYWTQDRLGNVAKTTAQHLGGNAKVNDDGNLTAPTYRIVHESNPRQSRNVNNVGDAFTHLNNYINEGWEVHDKTGQKAKVTPGDKVKFVAGNGATVNVAQEQNGETVITIGATPQQGGPAITNTNLNVQNGKVQNPAQGDAYVQAGNLAQTINNVSWKAQGNGQDKADVKAGSKVNFADGDNTKAVVTHAGDTTTVKYNAETSKVKFENGTASKDGDKLAKAGDVADVTNKAVTHLIEKGMNFEGNTGGAVHKNLGEKLTVKGGHGGQGVSDKNTYVANENGNLVVKFAENPEFKGVKLVNNGNTVNLNPVAGNKLNLGGGNNNAPVVIGNVANGVQDSDAVNVSQLKDLKWKLDVDAAGGTATGQGAVEVGSQTVTVLAGNGIKVEKNGTNLTISSTVKPGAPVQNVEYADLNVGTDGKVATPSNTDGAKAVNATTVAKAINDSGWKVTSGTADGGAQDGNPTNKLVKAGDQVTLQAGKNLKVKQEDGKFTFGTQENVTFTHVDSNSVTIGKGSTPATTNPVTLTANNGVLKVAGNNDAAAKITNVAPADISETSKDAVNGSQLYALGNSVRNVFGGDTKFENGAVKDFKYQVGKENGNYGNQANNVTDAFKNLNDYVNEGIKVAQNDADKGKLTPTETLNFKDTDSVTGTVTANGDKVDVSFAVKTGKVKAENKKAVADDAAGKIATVADVADTVNNVAWSVQEKGAHKADVKAGSKVDFVDGDNTKVSVTHAGDTTTVKYSVDTGEVKFDPADNQAKAPDANKVAKAGDVANVTNAAVKHVVDTGMKFAGNDGNPVHKKLGETLNIEGGHNGTGVSSKNTYVSKDGDKLLVQFAENPEFKGVKLADGNHVVNLSPVEGNKLKLGGGNTNAPVTISNVADGVDGKDAVNVSQLNALKWKLDVDEDGGTATGKGASEVGNGTVTVVAGKGIGVKKDGNKVTISADVPEVSFADLSVGGDGKVVNPGAAEGGKSVNATTVANAINNSGWLAQAGAVEGGVVEGGDQAQLVKAGDKVTLQAGKNLKVKQDGNNFTFGTQETVTFTGVNSNTVTIGKGSDPATANPVTLTAKDGVLKVEANDGAAAKITNVAPADLSETSTDAVNGSQLYALGDSIRNVLGGDTKFEDGKVQGFDFQVGKEDQSPYGNKAGNVQDALTNLNAYINEGIKVGDNAGTEVAKLTPTDQLNFKDGDNTASKVEAGENGTVNVSFDVKTGSVTVGEDKKAVANEDSGKIATVGDVANAVNNVAWTLQEKGADKADIKAGSKVNFIDGDSTKVTIGEDNGATTVKYEVNTAALTGDVTFTDGKASTPDENKLAKTGDVANVTNKAVDHLIDTGMKFAGNDGAEIHKKLGETLNLEGGNDGAAVSDKNTYIANENGKLKVKFADNPEFKGIDLKDGGNTVKLGSTPEGLKLSNADGAPVSISNVSSGLNTHADGKPAGLLDLTGNGKNGAPVADNTAATVGDLRNMGWVISADKTQDDNGINNTPYSGQVKNAGEVKISGGDLVKVSGKNDNGVHTITVDLDAQNITNHAQLPVVYTDTEGNKVYKQPDGSFTKQPDGTGDKVNADDVIASMNSGGDDTKAPTTLANVKGNLNVVDDAGNKVYDATGEKEVAGNRTESTAVPELKANNAATVSDVVNAGWNLKANGEAKDFVRHSDTVDFVNGYGSNIVIDNKDGKTSSIRIDTPLSYTDGADVKNVGNKVMGEPTNSITLIGGNQDAPVRLHNVASGVGENLKDDAFVTALENATGSQLNNAVNVADLQNLNKAINTAAGNTGFNLNASKSEGGELGDSKATDKRIGNGETMTLDAGKNIKITQIDNGFSVATSDNLNVVSVTAKDGDKTTKLDGNGLTITPATGGVVSLTGTGLDNGGNKIVNVADGKVAPDSKEAVNGSQLYQVYQVVGGDPAKTNFTTLEVDVVQPDGSVTKQKVPSSNGYTLTTYNVKDRGKYLTNNVIEAVGRMNEEGIKFFHTNDGVVKPVEQGKSTNDSSASGAYATAVGYKADASGESTLAIGNEANASGANAIAIGKGAGAIGDNSISIGVGNQVTGKRSGAIGDPSVVSGDGSYTIGNDNKVATNSTFVLGSNVETTADNSVFLGDKSAYVAASDTQGSTGGADKHDSSKALNQDAANVADNAYAGRDKVVGVVSVGNAGETRRIQNVAPGMIGENSTDAVNGSQLYALQSTVNNVNAVAGAGWNLGVNDEAPVTVKPTGNAPATVKFVDGQGTTVSLDKTAPQPTVKIDTPLAHVYNEDGSKADAVSLVVNKDDKGNLQPVTIHNVAPGKRGTDAVNVDQLKAGLTQIHNRLGDIADEADAGTAAAMATAGLPQAYLPGKSMVSVAGSTYRGKQGYAVGFSAISDGGNWVIKGSVNGHTRGHFGATVGAGYQW